MSLPINFLDIFKPIASIIDKAVPDKDLAAKLKNDIQIQSMEDIQNEFQTRADIIKAEAQNGSWLSKSWRPIVMLTFTGLIVAHWLGWTPDTLPASEVEDLMDLVKIGLGGYVIGRSGEKIATTLKGK